MGNSVPVMIGKRFTVNWFRLWSGAVAAVFLLAPGVALTQEAPALVRFEGLVTYSQEKAREAISRQLHYIRERGVSPARADDAAHFLSIAMHRDGYPDADVQWDIEDGVIVLRVSEAKLVMLGSVTVKGNHSVGADVIESLIREPTRSRANVSIGEPLPFVESEVREGEADVRALYANLGYFNAGVDLEIAGRESSADVVVTVKEGPLFRIRSIEAGEHPDELLEPVGELIAEFEGSAYTPSSASALQGRVLELYANEGYTQAEITLVRPSWTEVVDEKEVPVTVDLHVERGTRLSLDKVTVEGNQRVREAFFLNRFEPLQGHPYDAARADKIVSRMLRSGAFSKVELRKVPNLDEGTIDIVLGIEETSAREVGLHGGFGSWEGYIVGATFQHYNLLGAVRRLDSGVELTGRGISGNVDVYEPWALGEKTTISAGLRARRRDQDGYTKFDFGAHIELKYDIADHLYVTVFTDAEAAKILDHHVVDEALGDDAYFLNSVGLAFTYDKRDSPVLPTNGLILSTSGEVASSFLASDVEFLRGTARLSYYRELWKLQLQAGARAGIIVPIGDTDQLPIDVRFFNGGSTTVRGFPQRELGPQDRRGNPIGGQFYTTLNAEAALPVFKGFKVAGFYDAGNLLADHEDASLDDMRYSAGVGLRYDLPIGPLRLDYGWNLDPKEDESSGAFHFGIGVSF